MLPLLLICLGPSLPATPALAHSPVAGPTLTVSDTLPCAEPDTLDFGEVPLKAQVQKRAWFHNRSDWPAAIYPHAGGSSDFTYAPPVLVWVPAHSSYPITVTWSPRTLGPSALWVDLGCAWITCIGTAVDIPPLCRVEPETLAFGAMAPDETRTLTLTLANDGGRYLQEMVPSSCGPFEITGTVDIIYLLGPLESEVYEVSCTAPWAPGPVTCVIDPDYYAPGSPCSDVVCTATVVVPNPYCVLDPQEIDFGDTVPPGGAQTRSFTITNAGGTLLTGEIIAGCDGFAVSPTGPFSLEPGASLLADVTFTPVGWGPYTCNVGVASCGIVTCRGEASACGDEPRDRIGIYWDPEATTDCLTTSEAPPLQRRRAYLCLTDPSGEGIAGWEGRLAWDGPVQVLDWQVEGIRLQNILAPPEFMVRLSVPLPRAEVTVLASADVMPLAAGEVLLYVRPLLSDASIPGWCCYADGMDPDVLIPLAPSHGSDAPAARIGPSCTGTPVAGGVPTAEIVTGGTGSDAGGGGASPAVRLQWRYDPGQGDGCHLYRRQGSGGEERLTDLPLSAPDGRIEFLDDAAGVAPGTGLSYQFTLLRDGREVGRSAEVALTWAPPVPSALVLHPCRPNPFNPQTTIVFDLPRAGRVRLTVHDLAGRLVRTLLDGPLPAGTHQEIWTGIDQGGRRVPSGTYYCRLETEQGRRMVKTTLLK